MCGIIGYIGKEQAAPLLLEGLKRQSYRGYDSSGIVVFGKATHYIKAVGKLEKLEEKVSQVSLEGTTGIGHCLAPGTLIQMADGRSLPISEIQDGEEVLSMNIETRLIEKASVKVTKHKSPKKLYYIRTPFAELHCTSNHQMFVYREGQITAKKAINLKKGEQLINPVSLSITGSKMKFRDILIKRYYTVHYRISRTIENVMHTRMLNVPTVASAIGVSHSYMEHILQNDRNFREDELQKITSFFSIPFPSPQFVPQDTIHGKFIHLPQESSPGLMQVIGYFLGDGTAQPKTVRFKDVDVSTLWAYQKLIDQVFNVKGRVVPQNDTVAWLLEVNSVYLSQWIKENVVSRKKEFLSEVGKLPKAEIAAFLRGLFDAEGSVGIASGQLLFGNTNEYLAKIVQSLLLRFHIVAHRYRNKRSIKTWKDAHIVYISNRDVLEKFQEQIKFTSSTKSLKLKTLIIQKEKNRNMSRKKIEEAVFAPNPILEIKKVISNTDLLYDLEITPNSNFFANGLLSHNSRWATHGGVTEENAHPHEDCKSNIFVVHNGIIENYQILKEKLEAKRHKFVSQTDTEVLPHLIEHFFQGNLEEAVRKALQLVKGTYGIAVIAKEDPGKIVAARLSSPLVISVNGSGGFVASDPAALLSHSNKMVFLDDKEIAVIQPDKFFVTDIYNKLKEKEVTELDWTLEEAQKGGYPHFMLKEIMEHPESLENTIRGRLLQEEGLVKLGGLEKFKEQLRDMEKIQILACGSASYVARAGEYMLEEYGGIPTEVDIASEFRYRKPVFDKKTLSIFISQSGETADTLAALKEVKEKGGLTVGVVNVVGSSVARGVDAGVYIHAGPEIAVAATKSVTSQLAALALISVFLGRQRQLSLVMGSRVIKELARIPELAKKVLENTRDVEKTAEKYSKYSNFFVIGRKYNFPVALEGALKLKETAYIHAEAFGGGELKHGSLALINEDFPTIAICPSDSVYEKMISNIQEIKARNGPVLAIATEGNEDIKKIADDVITIPKTLEMLTPILSVIPLQLFAYYMGVLRGYDVDKPRNLAKSVTVE